MRLADLGRKSGNDWKEGGVLVYGEFNIIHPGHIRFLKHAKEYGSHLSVALVAGDKPLRRGLYPQDERAEALSLLGLVDSIVCLDDEGLVDAVKMLRPKTVVLGSEDQDNNNVSSAIEWLKRQGIEVKFHPGYASSAAEELLYKTEDTLAVERLLTYKQACKRYGLSQESLVEALSEWNESRVVVIGDVIVDQYAVCDAMGMSAEAPVVVVRECIKKDFLGGAGVVASHIQAMGGQCELITVVGDDKEGSFVKEAVSDLGVSGHIVRDSSRPTTFKKRYMVENQKLFRVSRLEEKYLNKEIEEEVIRILERRTVDADAVVISDFVYGVITERVLARIVELSVEYGFMLLGDVQCSSQVGSILRFKDFSLLAPNEREIRVGLQDKDRGIEELSQIVLDTCRPKSLIVKMAGEGFILYQNEGESMRRQAFPALSVNPVDVAGAGDSLLASMALGVASRQELVKAAALACIVSKLAVETLGNKPISKTRIEKEISEIFR